MSGFTPDSPEFQAFLAQQQDRQTSGLFDAPNPTDYQSGETLKLSDVRKSRKGKAANGSPPIDTTGVYRPDGGGGRSLAERARARTEKLFNVQFPVPELDDPEHPEDPPFIATIKQPDMMMLLEAKAVPAELRKQINHFLKMRDDIGGDDGTPDLDRLQAAVQDDLIGAFSEIMGVADVICVESFVAPRLVWTEIDELRDPINCLYYKRIPTSARQRLWSLIRNAQEGEQQAVAGFPVEPEPAVRTEGDLGVPAS